MLPLQGVRVQSLARELRSHKPRDVAKKKKKKSHLNYREGDTAEMGHATEEMGVGTESPWTEEPGRL